MTSFHIESIAQNIMDSKVPTRESLHIINIHLQEFMFRSAPVVEIDSALVWSIFGQAKKKKIHRTHNMQTLSPDLAVKKETRDLIYNTFEENKQDLDFGDWSKFLRTARNIASIIHESTDLNKLGSDSKEIIEWCISAYSLVINRCSHVKLSCFQMGEEGTMGFGIHAVVDIREGDDLYELIGLMPKDNRAKHSGVSSIKPNKEQNQSPRVERILFGPLRFMNHICKIPNVEFIACSGTSAFYALAARDIRAGEELLVDYGKDWFGKEPGGCPCLTCKPDTRQERKRERVEEDEEAIKAKKADAKRAKRYRQKLNSKEKKVREREGMAGPSTS